MPSSSSSDSDIKSGKYSSSDAEKKEAATPAEGGEEGDTPPLQIRSIKDAVKMFKLVKKILFDADADVTIKKIPKAADAGNCDVDGEGLKNGEVDIPCNFTVTTKDNSGKPLKHGETPVSVKVTDPEGNEVPVEVKNNGDGTYDVEYTPVAEGKHKVEVDVGDKPVKDSPFEADIEPPTPDPSQCTAEGPGLEKAAAGEKAPFKVIARNKLGNPLKVGGHDFKPVVTDESGREVPANITDNGDGTYDADYTPIAPGKHTVAVTVLEDKPIKDSPFTVDADANSSEPLAENCKVSGKGVEGGCTTAEPADFVIESIGPDGEPLKEGGSKFDADVTDPEGNEVPVEIKDNGDGTYSGRYQPLKPGKHKVEIMLRNPRDELTFDHVDKSPYEVEILPGIDASKCKCEGEGLESGKPEDVKKATFNIIANDILGNPIKEGGANFEVEVTDPEGKPLPEERVNVKDNGDGTYTAEYEPDQAGPHVVKVTLKNAPEDRPVADSPYTVEVIEGADAENTAIGWFGFTLQARDKKGEPLTTGGAKFEVVVKPNKIMSKPLEGVETKDNGDGTYTAKYQIEEPGVYKIRVKINGKKVKGSPFKQTVGEVELETSSDEERMKKESREKKGKK